MKKQQVMINRFLLSTILIIAPAISLAEITPAKGHYDARVRVVDYNPMNVVKLSTFFGVSTHVQFAQNESIQDVAIGDEQAWKVVQKGNHLFIKPTQDNADTNITVITNKRTYQFSLIVQPKPKTDPSAWADPNLIFSLSFRYPDEEAAKLRADEVRAAAIEAAKTNEARITESLTNAKKEIVNLDYWVAGSEEISPSAARDDGRFVYLVFNSNRDMPAVYEVDAQGNEALVNTNVIDGNTIVIQRLIPRIMLRKGSLAASVVNKSFRINGGSDNTTGTISNNVERILKGAPNGLPR